MRFLKKYSPFFDWNDFHNALVNIQMIKRSRHCAFFLRLEFQTVFLHFFNETFIRKRLVPFKQQGILGGFIVFKMTYNLSN